MMDEGIYKDRGEFIFDFDTNSNNDIISISKPQLYKTIKSNRIYYFGYTFNSGVDSNQRTEFINAIKFGKIPDDKLERFIQFPLVYLDRAFGIENIDCFVYPLSNRSELVNKIVKSLNKCLQHSDVTSKCSFELVKSAPSEISFDFDSFEADYGDEVGYTSMVRYVKCELLPKIHQLVYFSLAHDVKPKYRSYITNYLNFSKSDFEKFSKLHGENILVVDDINTTGSTIDEILRKLTKINNNCNIYIYTLLGKE